MIPIDGEMVAQLCAQRAGLKVDPAKAYLMENRLGPLARREGYAEVGEMLAALQARREDRLAWAVVEAMAASETTFFRDRTPFALFANDVLPSLASLRKGEPIRVWSAACGAGQEIYSLAMIVDEMRGQLGQTKVELFGSDLSERNLERAQAGRYSQFEIQRGLPIRRLVDHFEKDEDSWVISSRIGQMVRWRRVNLISDLSAAGRFDVIFCRYLLCQLTAEAKPRLLANLARAISPEGFVVLGEGENVQGLSAAFQPVNGRPGLFARNPAFRAAA